MWGFGMKAIYNEMMEYYTCSKCNTHYRLQETAELCCIEKGGCGKKATPNQITTHVCGETISNMKWYFCKSCQRKKQNAWRTAFLSQIKREEKNG